MNEKAIVDQHEITILLEDVVAGKAGATDQLLDQVYHILHGIAESYVQRESSKNELQATELVNEAYLKVLGHKEVAFENRRHMYGAFANAMREVLVDAARRKNAKKREHSTEAVPLSVIASPAPEEFQDALLLDSVVSRLESLDERSGEVTRLKCFAGLADKEIAEITGLSERTVQREWSFARAFLRRAIAERDSCE